LKSGKVISGTGGSFHRNMQLFLYLLENKKNRLAGWFIKATEICKNYLERLNFLDETA